MGALVSSRYLVRPASWQQDQAALRAIRQRVFIDEQRVPENLEWDAEDECAQHFLAFNDNGEAVGCARLLADGHCGRMAVLANWRHKGIGRALLEAVIQAAQTGGLDCIRLSAQCQASEFYKKDGFETVGDEYLEAGIPHVIMQKTLNSN